MGLFGRKREVGGDVMERAVDWLFGGDGIGEHRLSRWDVKAWIEG